MASAKVQFVAAVLVGHTRHVGSVAVTVFDVFVQVPYELLTIKRGNVYGNRIVSKRSLMGVFKLKSNMDKANGMELLDSDATLHAHPNDFAGTNTNDLVGQGIRINGQDYSIEGVSEGMNFDNGILEHIYMRLQKASFVEADNGR